MKMTRDESEMGENEDDSLAPTIPRGRSPQLSDPNGDNFNDLEESEDLKRSPPKVLNNLLRSCENVHLSAVLVLCQNDSWASFQILEIIEILSLCWFQTETPHNQVGEYERRTSVDERRNGYVRRVKSSLKTYLSRIPYLLTAGFRTICGLSFTLTSQGIFQHISRIHNTRSAFYTWDMHSHGCKQQTNPGPDSEKSANWKSMGKVEWVWWMSENVNFVGIIWSLL